MHLDLSLTRFLYNICYFNKFSEKKVFFYIVVITANLYNNDY